MRLTFLSLFVASAAAQRSFSTNDFRGILTSDSGVLQSLRPASQTSFDFSPSDYFSLRNGVGNYHTGDLTLRWRVQGQTTWNEVDTAAQRNVKPVSTTPTGSLLRSTFDNVFPDAAKQFSLTRDWKVVGNDIVLQANITSKTSTVEIGAFGFPIEFNSIFTNRTADDTTVKCSLVDPYIGLDAGYAQVTRLTGTGPNLVVTPYGNSSKFEAWRFLRENTNQPTAYQSQVFEGLYAWQTLSKAYAQNEWKATQPWNNPTSITLNPGQTVSFGLRFALSQAVSGIEDIVASKGVPVAVGIPGYVLPTDLTGQLFLKSAATVQSIAVEPQGALTLTPTTAKNNAWKAYTVKPASSAYGRARLTIVYTDGKTQTVHYYITDTGPNTQSKVGNFLFSKQWYTDTTDPFKRAPSVISYDYEAGQMVLQDNRVWIAGISDEGGAGAFEAAAMKTAVQPNADEVSKLEQMVNTTVWGVLQDKTSSSNQYGGLAYGVKRSVFFYEPSAVPGYNYTITSGWNKQDAYSIWRAYDYVHVSALYWGLYSAERASPGILKLQKPTWYLAQAHKTILASQALMPNGQPYTAYGDVGLMGETVWFEVLKALQAEGLTSEASALQAAMKKRQDRWATQSEPFGSEMAWDSTGQEGVYLWSKYFKDTNTVTKTLNSIRGYMPTVPHWGWNGNARRYWDFLYGGKLTRIERMIHHYGSGLNALPLLDAYKYNTQPSSAAALYDLRVGYGGNTGATTNINSDGFGAMAFHSWPDTMKWDGYSGDYGPNFLGHIQGACTFLVDHPDFGLVSFGGNLASSASGGSVVSVQPRDTVRRRIYIAPLGLRVEVDAGVISQFQYDPAKRSVVVSLAVASGQSAKSAIMAYEDTISSGVKLTTTGLQQSRGGYSVPLPGSVAFSL